MSDPPETAQLLRSHMLVVLRWRHKVLHFLVLGEGLGGPWTQGEVGHLLKIQMLMFGVEIVQSFSLVLPL